MANQSQHGQHQGQDERHKGGQHSPGKNFKDDPERAREAGQKGGEHSRGGRHEKEE